MKDFFEMIYMMRKRPGMYFGNKFSVNYIRVFIDGYITGKGESVHSATEISMLFGGFNDYLQKKYNYNKSYSWCMAIRELVKEDSASFNSFFELFDEYLINEGIHDGLDTVFPDDDTPTFTKL